MNELVSGGPDKDSDHDEQQTVTFEFVINISHVFHSKTAFI